MVRYDEALDKLEDLAERYVGFGEQIEFVRLPTSLEIHPARVELASIGVFGSIHALDVLIGSVFHESIPLVEGEGALDRARCLLEAAFDGRVEEEAWKRSGRLLYGRATVTLRTGDQVCEIGLPLLRVLGKKVQSLYKAYPAGAR